MNSTSKSQSHAQITQRHTPWRTEPHPAFERLVRIIDCIGAVRVSPIPRSTAELIVAAVNSHADMLAALKSLLATDTADLNDAACPAWKEVVDAIEKAEARAAIAKATEAGDR